MDAGIVIVAYGFKAHAAARECVASARQVCDLPISIITDSLQLDGVELINYEDKSFGARWAKLNQDTLTAYEATIYLDADTQSTMDFTPPLQILNDGYDLAIAPSSNQDSAVFRHIAERERVTTYDEVGLYPPLQLQVGVMYWRRNATMTALFEEWRAQWRRWEQQDQAALVRAIEVVKPKIWLLGHPYNDRNGEIIQHHFGKAR